MIDWLWLIPAFIAGYWLGFMAKRAFGAGATTGVIGTLLALLFIG